MSSRKANSSAKVVFKLLCFLVILLWIPMANAAELKLPSGLKYIEAQAFYGNSSLETVTIQEGTVSIGSEAFAQSGIRTVVLPTSLTFIANDAFDGCSNVRAYVKEGSYAYDWATSNENIHVICETIGCETSVQYPSAHLAGTDLLIEVNGLDNAICHSIYVMNEDTEEYMTAEIPNRYGSVAFDGYFFESGVSYKLMVYTVTRQFQTLVPIIRTIHVSGEQQSAPIIDLPSIVRVNQDYQIETGISNPLMFRTVFYSGSGMDDEIHYELCGNGIITLHHNTFQGFEQGGFLHVSFSEKENGVWSQWSSVQIITVQAPVMLDQPVIRPESTYAAGRDIIISFDQVTNASYYQVQLIQSDIILKEEVLDASVDYICYKGYELDPGEYMLRIIAANDYDYSSLSEADISIVGEKGNAPVVHVDNNEVFVGDTYIFTLDLSNVDRIVCKITNLDTSVQKIVCIDVADYASGWSTYNQAGDYEYSFSVCRNDIWSLWSDIIPVSVRLNYDPENMYTLDIYWVGNGDNEIVHAQVEEAINAYIAPLIGAKVSLHIIGWGEWNDKAINALQSGEKMDLIFTADWEGYGIEVNGNLLLPLDDLLEQYGQGIKDTLPQNFLEGAKVNGVLYGIPTNKDLCVPEGFIINKTAAAAIGWNVTMDDPSIRSTADLEPWLAKYKEMFPNKYPYLMDGMVTRWADEPWCPDWAGMYLNSIAMKMAVDEDGQFDDTIYSIFETPEQEEHIRLMYDWAQKGYISPQAALTSFDYNGVFGRGDFLAYAVPLNGYGIKSAEMYYAYGTEEFECVEIIMQPKYVVTVNAGNSMFGIPRTSQNPEAAMKYLNLMHSDANLVNLMVYGAEGVNYTRVDENTIQVNSDANWYGVHGGAWTVGNTALQYVTTEEDPQKNILLQDFAKDAVATLSLGFRFVKDSIAEIVNAVDNVVYEMAVPLMAGQVDPDDQYQGIDALKTALKNAGIARIIDEIYTQFQAWLLMK